MADFEVDLFVIGAGSGGVRAGRIAAGYGAKVMIAEEFRIGGTCVIRGCVPKKLYVYASRFSDDFTDAAGFGWTVPQPSFDWATLVANKDREITRMSGVYKTNAEKAGAQILEERAEVAGPQSIRLPASGRTVSARTILIATGGTPSLHPTIPGLEHAISSNEAFDLPRFPKRVLIVGAGYIGIEFASIFARLGAEVVLCNRGQSILAGFDDDMREGLREALAQEGIGFRFGTLPTRIDKGPERLRVAMSDGSALVVDEVMVATGRKPLTQGLGLQAAGVALDKAGAVVVDAYSRTSVPSIYAVGDVTNRVNLTPVAIREGHAFADTVFGKRPTAVDHDNIPHAVFATPEIGAVGLTEGQACERFPVVDIYKANFRPLKAVLSGRHERVIMKIVVDGISDRVLGVHILGHDAGEIVQLAAVAIRLGATKADFDTTMALHPSAAEELVTMRTRTARHERALPQRASAPMRVAT